MKRLMNRQLGRGGTVFWGLVPFLILIIVYLFASEARLALNPKDKLLPSMASFGEAIYRLAFEPSQRSGEILLWADTLSSLKRLGLGVGISAATGLLFGVTTGILPYVRANLLPSITVLSMVPPMAVLPILFIVFGLGEVSKVVLIVFGIAPFITRDIQQRVAELPLEQLIKAQTLGATTWQVILRVVLPQILPRLLDAVRLSLGAAWLFLIAAEAVAATDGLGYRIFLVRRYLAMDTILPYVAWITLLATFFDFSLRRINRFAFPWFQNGDSPS